MTDLRHQYRLMDLFAGCGGMTRGFVDTGRYTPEFAVEWDKDAAATYAENFGDHVFGGPIEDVSSFPAADVVVGGPPCQAFSPLNRDRVGIERRKLWEQYVRALSDAQPHVFVMENVPELLRSDEFAYFLEAVQDEDPSWRVQFDVLNAADFGVPQRRRRAIVIGTRLGGEPPWPVRTHYHRDELRPSDAPTWQTFRDATGDLPLEPDGESWHRARNPRPESIRRYQAVPHDGGDRFQMQENLDREDLGHLVPRCWRNKPTGTTDVFGRLWWDEPSFTIRTEFYKPEKGRYLHPQADRPITVREAARCMSFDDEFILPEEQSMTSIAKQVGNAVPPLLGRAIASAVAAHLDAADLTVGRRAA